MKKHTDITIRPATSADVGAIASILRELGWFAHINEEPPADTEARIARYLELCKRLGEVDPFFYSLTELRDQLSALFKDYFEEHA